MFIDLEQRFESAIDITEDDAREWSRQLGTAKRKARTVNDVWINAARTVFAWAERERLVGSNPFKGLKVTQPRRVEHRETKAFMPAEWTTILRASSAITPKTTFQGAQRWVPWLCAYSGARPGEITQLRGEDIERRGQIYIMKLTPAAGTIKTGKPRTVPLHAHLIEQGFLNFVRDRGNGPLFCNPKEKEDGTSDPLNPKRHPAEIVRRRLADWVRKLGISDDELSPMHAWRHTFKARADRAEISERMSDYITGHAQRTVGAKYGAPTVEDMAAALEKFPRYEIA